MQKVTLAVALIAIVIVASVAYAIYAFVYIPGTTPSSNVLKIALVHDGYEEDPYGRAMVYAVDQAAMELNTTGRPIVVAKSFGVSVAHFRRVVEVYVDSGYQLIIVPHVGYESIVKDELAAKYPDTYFLGGGGWTESALGDNVAIFAWDYWKAYYPVGMIVGSLTNTTIIGWTSAFEFPDMSRLYNILIRGAQEVNPNITGKFVFTGDFHDPVKGALAARSLRDAGADMIVSTGNGMTEGAIKECEGMGVYTIGYYWDQHELAPSVILTSVKYVCTPYIKLAIDAIDADDFGNNYWSLGWEDDVFEFSSYYDLESVIPESTRNSVSTLVAQLKAGTVELPQVSGEMPSP